MQKVNVNKIIVRVLTAIVLGTTWSILGRREYFYNHNFGSIGGVSLYPLILFSLGLELFV